MSRKMSVEDLHELKYLDLHFHLDGSITVEIAKQLAKLQNINLQAKDETHLIKMFTVKEGCASLRKFLKRFRAPSELLQTKEGISEAVYLVQENFKKRGGIYLEIRFAPQFHRFKGLSQEEVIQAALEGLKRSDLKCNLILCIMRRDDNKEMNRETIELAKKYLVQDNGVVGVDIAGDEKAFPITLFEEEFKLIREYNIPFTIHAGEAEGPESIINALNMGAKRIGHGIRCVEDEALMDRLVKENIYLEVCPHSNFCTGSMTRENYPFRKLLEKGIKVTINTDDMGIVGCDIHQEFNYLVDTFNLEKEECIQILNNSVDAAFTSQEVKKSLREIIKSI